MDIIFPNNEENLNYKIYDLELRDKDNNKIDPAKNIDNNYKITFLKIIIQQLPWIDVNSKIWKAEYAVNDNINDYAAIKGINNLLRVYYTKDNI